MLMYDFKIEKIRRIIKNNTKEEFSHKLYEK